MQRAFGGLERRRQTEDDAGQDRDRQREPERRRIGMHAPEQRNAHRVEARERARAAHRQQ